MKQKQVVRPLIDSLIVKLTFEMNYLKAALLVYCLGWMVSCTYTEKIKDGPTAYARKQFKVAIPMLQQAFSKAKDSRIKAETAYMLGESYRRMQQSQEAADWYQKAQKNRYGKDTDIKYARMLQQLQRYDEAKRAFQSAGRYAGDVNLYREQMIACVTAQKWLDEVEKNLYRVQGLSINTAATDFCPILLGKQQLLITSDRQESEGKETYQWTGNKFFDLFTIDLSPETVQKYASPINQAYHQGTLVYSADGQEVFYTQCGSDGNAPVDYCQIFYRRKEAEVWSEATPLKLGADSLNYLHPVLSKDGNLLIFACNNPRGFGGYDLYFSIKMGASEIAQWSEPLNMGSRINTKGNEVFPYLDQDSLYYSSDGHPGMGGLDIFKSTKKFKRWQRPQNLKAPLNSGGDDFGFILDRINPIEENHLTQGYFSSNREGGKGSDDIYHFKQSIPPPADTSIAVDSPSIELAIRLEGLVKEKKYRLAGNPNSPVEGYDNLMGVSIRVSTADTAFTVGSDLDGTFYVRLDTATDYQFKATKNGYFNQIATLTTKGIVLSAENPDTTLFIEIILEKIFLNQEITLENIYYDYDEDKIREDAKKPLDSLVVILKQNPQISIQLASHTDCRGQNAYNEKLSQRRAESAVQYLIQNSIDPSRLIAKGFGENKLAVTCKCSDCTDDEHQQNRRTTFQVLN